MQQQLPDEPVYPVVFGNDPFPPEGTEYVPPQFVPDEEALEQMLSSDDQEDEPSRE